MAGKTDKTKTEAEANEAAVKGEGDTTAKTTDEVADAGFYGTSPAREATGKADKGLSQATPAVMNQDG